MTEFDKHSPAAPPPLLRWKYVLLAAGLVLQGQLSLPAAASDYHFKQAVQYEFAGNPDAAVAEYRRALKSSPHSVDGHTHLGTVLLDEIGDVDGAISEFVAALSIDPGCRSCQARLSEAVDRKNATVKEDINRGNDFYRSGQLNRSAAAYRIAVSAGPQDPEARNCLAWTLYRMGRLEEALRQVGIALELKVDEPEYINTLACIQFDQGDVDAAIATWKRAIAKSKTPNPADLYGLAIGFLSKGNEFDAIKNFKEALKLDASYSDANYLRDKIGMSVHALATHEKLLTISGEKTAASDRESARDKSDPDKKKAKDSKN
jgi:tetratricopeptide (TPR) repeat protein